MLHKVAYVLFTSEKIRNEISQVRKFKGSILIPSVLQCHQDIIESAPRDSTGINELLITIPMESNHVDYIPTESLSVSLDADSVGICKSSTDYNPATRPLWAYGAAGDWIQPPNTYIYQVKKTEALTRRDPSGPA